MTRKVAVAIRRLEHMPYYDVILRDFNKRGYLLDIYVDGRYCSSVSEAETFFKENKIKFNLISLLQKESRFIRTVKIFLGVLIYIVDDQFEVGYFNRQISRSNIKFPAKKIEWAKKKFPKSTSNFAKLIVRLLRFLGYLSIASKPWELGDENYELLLVSPGNLQDSREDSLIVEARKKGIKSVVLALSFDNLNSKGTVIALPDIYLAWNDHHHRLLLDRHLIPKKRVEIVGSPYFEKYFNHAALKHENIQIESSEQINKDKKLVGYLGSSANISVNESDFLKRHLEQNPEFLEDKFLVIRPHPANYNTWVDWIYPGTEVIPKNVELLKRDTSTTIDFFRRCEFCFGINTSGFLDAIACGARPYVIINQEARFQENSSHFEFLKKSGVKEVWSLNELDYLHKSSTMNKEIEYRPRELLLPNFGEVVLRVMNKIL